MKVRRLKGLRVKRVDLVEVGANQLSTVRLFKSKDSPMEKPVDEKECEERGEAYSGETCPECEGLKKSARKEKKAMEATEKLQKDLETAMKLAEEEQGKREAIEKSLKAQGETVEALRKSLESTTAELKKADEARKLEGFKKSAGAFEHLPVTVATFAPILMKCAAALEPKEYEELTSVLKAGDAMGSGHFVERGASGHDSRPQSAAQELDTKAQELITKGLAKSDIEAQSAVLRANPRLAERYRQESYGSKAQERADA